MKTALVLGLGLFLGSSSAALALDPPAELRGSYAPAGDCTKLPKVTLTDVLTIQHAGGQSKIAPLDACFSCAGGARYEGIEVWVSQLDRKGEPQYPMFMFNAGERKGALVVTKDPTPNPAIRAVAAASPLTRCKK